MLREKISGKIVFTTSLGIEDQALTHAIATDRLGIEFATLDTGRLFPETYDVWAGSEAKSGINIAAFAPQTAAVEALVAPGRQRFLSFAGSAQGLLRRYVKSSRFHAR